MTLTALTPEQRQGLLEKVLALRQLTQETSMKTNRSQTQLLLRVLVGRQHCTSSSLTRAPSSKACMHRAIRAIRRNA